MLVLYAHWLRLLWYWSSRELHHSRSNVLLHCQPTWYFLLFLMQLFFFLPLLLPLLLPHLHATSTHLHVQMYACIYIFFYLTRFFETLFTATPSAPSIPLRQITLCRWIKHNLMCKNNWCHSHSLSPLPRCQVTRCCAIFILSSSSSSSSRVIC